MLKSLNSVTSEFKSINILDTSTVSAKLKKLTIINFLYEVKTPWAPAKILHSYGNFFLQFFKNFFTFKGVASDTVSSSEDAHVKHLRQLLCTANCKRIK